MKPDNLRGRARQLGIDLNVLRGLKRGTPNDTTSPLTLPLPRNAGKPAGGPKSARALYPRAVGSPSLIPVSSAVSEFTRRGDKPIRVLPEHGDRIRSGRRRLSAEADTDLDDTQLLAEFIEEGFEDWLKRKAEAIRRARETRDVHQGKDGKEGKK